MRIGVAASVGIGGDRGDIARAVEAARTEHPVELIANARLEIRESQGQKLSLADVKLRARIEAGIRCGWIAAR